MYINTKLFHNVDIIVPQKLIYDREHKNILPIYLTLYLKANHIENESFWESLTVKQLAVLSGVYENTRFRGTHYKGLYDAIEALEDMGYIKTIGLDKEDHKAPFSYCIKGINTDKDKYFLLPVDEYFYVADVISKYDSSNVKKDTAWRIYCCFRFYMNIWQRTYDKKYPAWVGRLDSVSNWLGMSQRTFSRFMSDMQDNDLLFVTYGAQMVGIDGFGKRSDTNVVFPFLAGNVNLTHITMLIEVRVRDKKGLSGCTWYKPGYRVLKKDKPEELSTVTADITIADIDEATEQNSQSIADDKNDEDEDIF